MSVCPLAIEFGKQRNVVGFDINQARVDELKLITGGCGFFRGFLNSNYSKPKAVIYDLKYFAVFCFSVEVLVI